MSSVVLATALCHASAALALPDGEGRETVETVCAACHGVNLIERSSGYSRDGWDYLASTMIDLSGNPTMQDEILDYLAEHFPPSDNRAATPVDGPLGIRIEEWKVPTLGQRSRDPVEAPDGILWWVNSGLGRLGRFDSETGDIQEWDSPSGPNSHPYAIAVFDGAVWYNESAVRPDMLVRFDPDAETFQSWPIPSGPVYAGILRHMRTTLDGEALLIHQSGTNQIGRVTVEAGRAVAPEDSGSK